MIAHRLFAAAARPSALRRLLQLGVLMVIGGLLPGVARAAPPVLTLAVIDNPTAAPLLIAEAEGYFAAEGLALKVMRCPIGRICLKHLLDGEAHFATVADTPITIASFSRKDFAIVATTTTLGHDHRMVVRQDRGIRSAADLKGKRVGILKGTSAHFFAETFLLFNGLDASDVTLVALDAKDAVGPLARGDVDAAGLFDPHGRLALQRLGAQARALPTPGFFAVTFNLVSVPAAAGATDDDVLKLLRAVQRAMALIRSQPERARAIVAGALKTDLRELAEIWKDVEFRLELAQPLITTLEAQARWAMRAQLVPAGAPMPNYLDLVRPEPLQRLEPRAVRLAR